MSFKFKYMTTKKQDAIKKLLGINDKEFKELQEKVLEDWAANVIQTKYQQTKSTDELVDEINET